MTMFYLGYDILTTMSQSDAPIEIIKADVIDWFNSLDSTSKAKLKRYLSDIDTSSSIRFFIDLITRSIKDHDYCMAVMVGKHINNYYMDDYNRFKTNELYIEGLFGTNKFNDAKAICYDNLRLFMSIKDKFLSDNNGSLPKDIPCRNRLIDILVGVESDYDSAFDALDIYVKIGIMDKNELKYRKQSLNIYRLQKSFDSIFICHPKDNDVDNVALSAINSLNK